MTKKVPDLTTFKLLAEEAQLNLLQKDAVFVGKRNLEDQKVMLFQLYGFYVEVFYRTYRKKIDHIIISADTNLLTPYLDQIQVRDLAADPDKNENH